MKKSENKRSMVDTISTIVLTVIAVILFIAIIFNSFSKKDAMPRIEEEAVETIVNVKVVEAEKTTFEKIVPFNGEIVSSEDAVAVYPDTKGIVKEILVEENQWVEQGEVLCYIDPSLPGSSYNLSPVKAPVSGIITSVDISIGMTLSTQSQAFLIESGNLEVSLLVPDKYLSTLEIGNPGEVSVSAYEGMTFDARISEISESVNETNRCVEVTLEVEDEQGLLKKGMYAHTDLVISTIEDVFVIPYQSVKEQDGRNIVYISNEDGSRAEAREITLVDRSQDLAAVSSGLEGGELIITSGAVRDQSAISIV